MHYSRRISCLQAVLILYKIPFLSTASLSHSLNRHYPLAIKLFSSLTGGLELDNLWFNTEPMDNTFVLLSVSFRKGRYDTGHWVIITVNGEGWDSPKILYRVTVSVLKILACLCVVLFKV